MQSPVLENVMIGQPIPIADNTTSKAAVNWVPLIFKVGAQKYFWLFVSALESKYFVWTLGSLNKRWPTVIARLYSCHQKPTNYANQGVLNVSRSGTSSFKYLFSTKLSCKFDEVLEQTWFFSMWRQSCLRRATDWCDVNPRTEHEASQYYSVCGFNLINYCNKFCWEFKWNINKACCLETSQCICAFCAARFLCTKPFGEAFVYAILVRSPQPSVSIWPVIMKKWHMHLRAGYSVFFKIANIWHSLQ